MITGTTKTRLAEFFRSRLDGDDLHFFQNNADADSAPPYGVITITDITETTPQSNVFRATIKLAIITSIDMSSSKQHDDLLEGVMLKLNNIPRRVTDEQADVRLFGWVITSSEAITKEETQSFSDVVTILAGCGG